MLHIFSIGDQFMGTFSTSMFLMTFWEHYFQSIKKTFLFVLTLSGLSIFIFPRYFIYKYEFTEKPSHFDSNRNLISTFYSIGKFSKQFPAVSTIVYTCFVSGIQLIYCRVPQITRKFTFILQF